MMLDFGIIAIIVFTIVILRHRELRLRLTNVLSIKKKSTANESEYYQQLIVFAFIIIAVIFCGILFGLDMSYIVILCFLGCIMFGTIVIKKNEYQKERRYFYLITMYMTQFASIFKVNKKIYSTLKEITTVMDGELEQDVNEAIEKIEGGIDRRNVLKQFEEKYNYTLIHNLHTVALEVELNGAQKFNEILDTLQNDIDILIEDTQLFQNKKQKDKRQIQLLTGVAVVIGYIAKSLIPSIYFEGIARSALYQIACFMFFLVLLITIYLSEKNCSGKWIEYYE